MAVVICILLEGIVIFSFHYLKPLSKNLSKLKMISCQMYRGPWIMIDYIITSAQNSKDLKNNIK